MADTATARVSGPVLKVDTRSGTSERGNYVSTTARVLVEDLGIAEVRIPDTMRAPIKGEDVDLLVEFGTYNGRLSCRAVETLTA
jgi:hypothetical protein